MGKATEYKGVHVRNLQTKATTVAGSNYVKNDTTKYYARKSINGELWHGPYRDTAKEAALDYDKKMISLNLNPVNVLKKK